MREVKNLTLALVQWAIVTSLAAKAIDLANFLSI